MIDQSPADFAQLGATEFKPRQVAVFGNCQAENLVHLLRAVPALASEFSFHYHFVRLDENRQDELAEQATMADVWLIQDVADWDVYPLRHALREEALQVRFPFLYMAALWPFDAHQNGPDLVALEKGAELGPSETFDFQDNLLARLRDREPDPEARYQAYRDLRTEGIPNLSRYLEADAVRLRRMDARLDVDLGAQMLADFRERRLFHAITHPTVETLQRIADAALRPLKQTVDWTEVDVVDRLSVFQVPIHPRVAAELGLTWVDDQTTYRFKAMEDLTFEQYYRRYIDVYG